MVYSCVNSDQKVKHNMSPRWTPVLILSILMLGGLILAAPSKAGGAPRGAPIPHSGLATPTETIDRAFSAWSIRFISGPRNFRYYFAQPKYYDRIFAVINLFTPLTGGAKQIAGDLVFFADGLSPEDVPIDLKDRSGSGPVLFYGRQDYDSVLASLQASSGHMQWMYLKETSGDTSLQYITGQLLLDAKK
jgi:hypothetical protein